MTYTKLLMNTYEGMFGKVNQEDLGFWNNVWDGMETGRLIIEGFDRGAGLYLRAHELKTFYDAYRQKKGKSNDAVQGMDEVEKNLHRMLKEWRESKE